MWDRYSKERFAKTSTGRRTRFSICCHYVVRAALRELQLAYCCPTTRRTKGCMSEEEVKGCARFSARTNRTRIHWTRHTRSCSTRYPPRTVRVHQIISPFTAVPSISLLRYSVSSRLSTLPPRNRYPNSSRYLCTSGMRYTGYHPDPPGGGIASALAAPGRIRVARTRHRVSFCSFTAIYRVSVLLGFLLRLGKRPEA